MKSRNEWVRAHEAAVLRVVLEGGRAVCVDDGITGLLVCGRPWLYREVMQTHGVTTE